MLLGPIQVLRYEIPNESNYYGMLVYYKKEGKSIDEFIYLIDYLFHYQQFQNNRNMIICLVNPCKDAISIFEAAKKEYLVKCNEDEGLAERLKIIKCRIVSNVIKIFNQTEIGMRYE
jgi:hypothetical protein